MPYAVEAPSSFAREDLVIDDTVGGVGFTASVYAPAGQPPATVAECGPLEAGRVRYTTNGTAPTTTLGHLLEVGDRLTIEGQVDIAGFRAIRVGSVSGNLPTTLKR